MAGISGRRQGELLRAVFEVLLNHPEGLPGREVLDQMAQRVPLSEYEQGHYKSSPGEPRAYKATRFYTVNCVKAGWLVKSKGTWQLTDAGRDVYRQIPDPLDLVRESQRRYKEWRATQPEGTSASPERSGDVDEASEEREAATTTVEEATERAWLQVRDFLMAMDAYDFQNLVAALLEAMGYHVHWVAPPGPDRGLDILAFTDPLGAAGPRIKVQVKRRQEKTTADGLRSFMAILAAGCGHLPLSRGVHCRCRA